MTQKHEMWLKAIRDALPNYEDPRRLEHTMGVYRECLWMSKTFGLSEEDSYTVCAAALLHDIAKNMTEADALVLAEKHGKTFSLEVSTVVHQYTGAMLAPDVFGREIVNDAMISAIACHTTGKAGMTPLDKMLFVADFTEAGRKYRSCLEIREYLHSECEKINKNDKIVRYRVLDEVTKRIVRYTITYLAEMGRKIDPMMIDAWNSMV